MTKRRTMWILKVFVSLTMIFMCMSMQAQTLVKGVVLDSYNEPMIGVTVTEKGGKPNATMTDIEGNYTLNVTNLNATLVFTYIGYKTVETPLAGKTKLEIKMHEDSQVLDELIVVGYGVQRKLSVTGAVAQISGDELLKRPVANITNMLGGTLPGVSSVQPSGQPGADLSELKVRGSTAKYIVDGVERSFAEIDPNEIESISVLKDGSAAAVYGLDAAAVIIVTTKRGKGEKINISFTGSYGVSQNTKMLQMLDGPQYAYWYNKAREMDGDSKIFTDGQVRKMIAGTDGWGNTNWYKDTFGTGHNSSMNVSASGGSKKVKFFTSIGNFNQGGNVDKFKYNRINIRSNIDAIIADDLTFSLDIGGRIEKRKAPGFGAGNNDWLNIGQQALQSLPYLPMEYGGMPVGSRTSVAILSPRASTTESGYNNSRRTSLQTTASLKYDMPFLKGMSVKGMVAYDINSTHSKYFQTPFDVNAATLPSVPGGDLSYQVNTDPRRMTDASLSETSNNGKTLTANINLSYANTFNGVHNVSAIVLGEMRRDDSNKFSARGRDFDFWDLDELDNAQNNLLSPDVGGMSNGRRKAGFVLRANYDYDGKYLVEVSGRYDGMDLFSGMDGKRWVLTPAASLGWRISEESWFKEKTSFFDNLKLRFGVGKSALTQGINQHIYYNTLESKIGQLVLNGRPLGGLMTNKPGNRDLTWVKTIQQNVGIDASMFRGKLMVEIDVFYKYIYDMVGNPGSTVPPSFGGFAHAQANINKQSHKGFEFLITHRNQVGEFSYQVSANGSYSKGKWLKYTESDNLPDWGRLTGKQVGSQRGFISQGLFQDQVDVDRSPIITGRPVRVGDIKYLDRNGDGVISLEQDGGFVAKPQTPIFTAGLQLSGEWRGIDLSMQFVAGLGRDVALAGVYNTGVMSYTSMSKPFYQNGNSPTFLLENSWTEDNPGGEFPRLTLRAPSTNNAFASSHWYRNGSYLRLKSAQIGYSLPKSVLSYIKSQGLRIYFEGSNLFTLSKLNKYNIDPEHPNVSNGYYPQQRVFSAGIKLTF